MNMHEVSTRQHRPARVGALLALAAVASLGFSGAALGRTSASGVVVRADHLLRAAAKPTGDGVRWVTDISTKKRSR